MVWRFSDADSSLLGGKCLFTRARNCLPMLVAKFILNGGFQNTTSLFLFLFLDGLVFGEVGGELGEGGCWLLDDGV